EAGSAAEESQSVDERINKGFGKATGWFVKAIFSSIRIADYDVLWVILWLAAAGIVFTAVFKAINIRAFPLALRTVRGKYSGPDDPGNISHFQALATAVSGTVGLGNIAGVAIGISIAGPGVAFWLFLSGFLGMATKFAECTLGVKYRSIDGKGHVQGGPMYYLKRGMAERGLGPVGAILAVFFAIFCVFASFGGGNIFQVNQVTQQLINVAGDDSFFASNQWVFGLMMALVTALVIIGGIKSIAKVTSKLVPTMCVIYILSALLVLVVNAEAIPGAIGMIVTEAFQPRAAVTGGILAAFIWGMRRATFSNEAGIGSAPIAHSAARTRKPASEGVVALLEPFVDTVIVCSMTSLVIVTTMQFDGDTANFMVNGQAFELGRIANNSSSFGIGLTSAAFETVNSGFKYLLFVCVLLFAFSTLVTWSYYGLQAWQYLFGKNQALELTYKAVFCLIIIAGASANVGNAVDFSDAALFAMSIPNLIGVYFMIPIIRREYAKFQHFADRVDKGSSLEEADASAEKAFPDQ
ncbi:MAG TPA: sodium:alanine symporter, partial [Verrucomicrobiales bacterium]|nr:sodium:alanine symporter [Verrucomicrobiales bacterium]